MKLLNFLIYILACNGGWICPEGDPPPADPPADPPNVLDPPPADKPGDEGYVAPSIWGEAKPEFPEGTEADIMESPSLKPFLADGKLNYANILKSYVHTKKQVGQNNVALPNEHSTEAELDEFYSKIGFTPNKEEYSVAKPEDSKLGDDFLNSVKDFAHSKRIPVAVANELVKFFEDQNTAGTKLADDNRSTRITEEYAKVQKEWGEATDSRKLGAANFLQDHASEEFRNYLKDSGLHEEPAIIKFFGDLHHKFNKEDTTEGGTVATTLTPVEASAKIAEIRASVPYNDPQHPQHKHVVAEVYRLYQTKTGERR